MDDTPATDIATSWPLPSKPAPIVIIGAGGIVNDAHLPAYKKAGLPVSGIFDLDHGKRVATAELFGIPHAFDSLGEACAMQGVVFDVAVPASNILAVLEELPSGATVLIQKPMGDDLAMARAIRDLCRQKAMTAAVNHQLRFAPACLAARNLIEAGAIGELHAMEVRVTAYTPWHLWKFLEQVPRVEIQYHSVHYLDLIRSFLGEPRGVYCRTLKHPDTPNLASVRTLGVLDYGENIMVGVAVNHNHPYGPRYQESFVKWEGTGGAIKATLGVNLNYPVGMPDTLELCTMSSGQAGAWQSVDLDGSWFPDAFIGTMANLQRFAAGEDPALLTDVSDVFKTMAVVEACYQSNADGGTPIPE